MLQVVSKQSRSCPRSSGGSRARPPAAVGTAEHQGAEGRRVRAAGGGRQRRNSQIHDQGPMVEVVPDLPKQWVQHGTKEQSVDASILRVVGDSVETVKVIPKVQWWKSCQTSRSSGYSTAPGSRVSTRPYCGSWETASKQSRSFPRCSGGSRARPPAAAGTAEHQKEQSVDASMLQIVGDSVETVKVIPKVKWWKS